MMPILFEYRLVKANVQIKVNVVMLGEKRMNSVKSLKIDKRFKNLVPYTSKEFQAMEQMAVKDGEVYHPLVSWKGQDILVYGYPYLKILKSHPELKFSIREIDFSDWEEAQAWAVEHYISQPEIRLWQKLVVAINCESYWILQEKAREAKGKRNDLRSQSDPKSESAKVNIIIANKIGCCETYVLYFKKIYSSGKTNIISQCHKGEMSIATAYNKLFPPKPKSGKGKGSNGKSEPKDKEPRLMVTEKFNVFDETEFGVDVGRKNIAKENGTPLDPAPIVKKMKDEKVPAGSIWVVLHKDKGMMQVVKKSKDEAKGLVHIKVNCYKIFIKSAEDGIAIFEADHINGSPAEYLRKDEEAFGEED
jgi:hypothetical protein